VNTSSGGQWSLMSESDARTANVVLSSTQTTDAVLWSSAFTGTDYTLDVLGRLVTGSVWRLGVHATDAENMYRLDLLGGPSPRLSVNRIEQGKTSTIAETALDAVNLSEWFTATVKAHGNLLDILVNDKRRLHVTDSRFNAGHVALVGPAGATVQFDRVLVHRYAANEPTVAVGEAEREQEAGHSVGWLGARPPSAHTQVPTAAPDTPTAVPPGNAVSPWLFAGAALVMVAVGGVVWLARRRSGVG
jgi:hypothetical protein